MADDDDLTTNETDYVFNDDRTPATSGGNTAQDYSLAEQSELDVPDYRMEGYDSDAEQARAYHEHRNSDDYKSIQEFIDRTQSDANYAEFINGGYEKYQAWQQQAAQQGQGQAQPPPYDPNDRNSSAEYMLNDPNAYTDGRIHQALAPYMQAIQQMQQMQQQQYERNVREQYKDVTLNPQLQSAVQQRQMGLEQAFVLQKSMTDEHEKAVAKIRKEQRQAARIDRPSTSSRPGKRGARRFRSFDEVADAVEQNVENQN